ncbi:MAG: 5-(carboxyamino)imidazole ribonucleotide synthase, partial [Gemmataceae bacterium]
MTAIGVLGGGQLGRMLALAGYPLGLRFRFLDPAPEAPVEQLAELMVGRFDDLEVLSRFPRDLQVITLEFENVPVESARHLARTTPLFPPPLALEISQDRLLEKKTFSAMGLVPALFHPVDSRDDLVQAVATIGLPGILKTRKLGYDGKGQVPIRAEKDIEMAWNRLGGVPLIYEGFVPFDRELSQISVRGRDGAIVHYPLVWNTHEGGILRLTRAPALDVSESLASTARRGMQAMMEHLDYVGVLAIEFFQVGDRLVANEMAPRVHNSGHWTIEGART